MKYPVSAATPNRLRVSASAKLWRIAGTMGPIIISRFRDVTFLFAGTLPDIAVALVNSVILPLITRKRTSSSDQS